MAGNLEIEGKITQKLPVQSGQSARGQWARQDFVVEYPDGSFPVSVCFSAWGQDKVQELDKYQVGDSVKVAFNVRGREYNGRWYNDLRAWRISPVNPSASVNPSEAKESTPPPPAAEDMPADFGDDMPF